MAFFNRNVLEERVVIDLDTKKTAATIRRGGVEYKAPETNNDAVVGLLDALANFTTFEEPRVLRQVPEPGTLVAPGTAISLTLVPPSDTPFNVFTGIHAGLLQANVGTLVQVLTQNEAVAGTVARYATAAAVPAAERLALAAAANLNIDDGQANTSFEAAFNSFKIASIYK